MCGRRSPVEAAADDDDGDNDDHDDDNAAAAAACPVQRQQQRQTWKLGLVQMEQLHQKSAPVLNSCVLLAFPAVAVSAAAAAASSRPPFAVCRWPFFIVPLSRCAPLSFCGLCCFMANFPSRHENSQHKAPAALETQNPMT